MTAGSRRSRSSRNVLVADADGSIRAEPTGGREVIPCGIVFRSVGYRGVAAARSPVRRPAGTIPNEGGRVARPDSDAALGVYCTGWIKRGPSGVIGTNKKDATETAELSSTMRAPACSRAATAAHPGSSAVLGARGGEVVTYAGWEAIDALERAQGEPLGRPRVKLCTWDELLAAARG